MPTGEVHPSVQSKIDSTRGSGTAWTRASRQALALARRPLRCPCAHRLNLPRPQPRRVRAAFATGTDVYFAQNEYKPNTSAGDQLIAHELAHVVQQRGAPTSGPLTVSDPGDAMESEADDVAGKIAP